MAETKQQICAVGTARIGYRGHVGQRVLDTTVKSATGLGAVFAPTWSMVMDWKWGKSDWGIYTQHYTSLMRERYHANQVAFLEALQSNELIVCCYCNDTHSSTQHCHRYLLVDILHKVADRHQIGFKTLSEVYNR
ncbi:MAG: hypothetical protein LCI00_15480 [Chloroflexi bacterium]|nr:hypothetical protein [Chloroflexota bacterium]